MKKGDADLYISKLDVYIEVTGPNIPMPITAPLWFRPDKFQNTEKKLIAGIGKMHFIIHVLDEKGTGNKILRAINIDNALIETIKANEFDIVYPTIRGRQETYIEINYNSNIVISFGEFVEILKSTKHIMGV